MSVSCKIHGLKLRMNRFLLSARAHAIPVLAFCVFPGGSLLAAGVHSVRRAASVAIPIPWGTVDLANQRPVKGASVFLTTRGAVLLGSNRFAGVRIPPGTQVQFRPRTCVTAVNGRFSFPAQKMKYRIFVSDPHGYADIQSANLVGHRRIILRPWCSLNGVVRVGRGPVANANVQTLIADSPNGAMISAPWFMIKYNAKSGPDGAFRDHFLMPGCASVSWGSLINWKRMVNVLLSPGKVAFVDVGGTGCTVLGKLKFPANLKLPPGGFAGSSATLMRCPPVAPRPKIWPILSKKEKRHWMCHWLETASGRDYQLSCGLEIASDPITKAGRVRFADVPPGRYDLQYSFPPPRGKPIDPLWIPMAGGDWNIVVPSALGGRANRPLQLGSLKLFPERFGGGWKAPPFNLKLLNGDGTIELSSFKGRCVLLYFWASWSDESDIFTRYLQYIHRLYRADPRLAIVSIALNRRLSGARKYVKDHGLHWIQAVAGAGVPTPIRAEYSAIDDCYAVLISSNGEVLASNIAPGQLLDTVASYVGHPKSERGSRRTNGMGTP